MLVVNYQLPVTPMLTAKPAWGNLIPLVTLLSGCSEHLVHQPFINLLEVFHFARPMVS